MCVCSIITSIVLLCARLQGTGIRLEDDVLITESAAEVLNKDTPETLDELAEVMR